MKITFLCSPCLASDLRNVVKADGMRISEWMERLVRRELHDLNA